MMGKKDILPACAIGCPSKSPQLSIMQNNWEYEITVKSEFPFSSHTRVAQSSGWDVDKQKPNYYNKITS